MTWKPIAGIGGQNPQVPHAHFPVVLLQGSVIGRRAAFLCPIAEPTIKIYVVARMPDNSMKLVLTVIATFSANWIRSFLTICEISRYTNGTQWSASLNHDT